MARYDGSGDTAANVERPFDRHSSRREQADEVIEDAIGHCLVEMPLIAERPEVELEALELDAERIGYIGDVQRREVGLPGHGADAGELGGFEADLIIALRRRIGESL
jgi:hypothetical protein